MTTTTTRVQTQIVSRNGGIVYRAGLLLITIAAVSLLLWTMAADPLFAQSVFKVLILGLAYGVVTMAVVIQAGLPYLIIHIPSALYHFVGWQPTKPFSRTQRAILQVLVGSGAFMVTVGCQVIWGYELWAFRSVLPPVISTLHCLIWDVAVIGFVLIRMEAKKPTKK